MQAMSKINKLKLIALKQVLGYNYNTNTKIKQENK